MTIKAGKAIWICMCSVVCCCLVAVFFHMIYRNIDTQTIPDFRIFWLVGDRISHGQVGDVYSKVSDGSFNETMLQYFWYPPNMAVLCVPLASLSLSTSFFFFLILLVFSLALFAIVFSFSVENKGRLSVVSKSLLIPFTFLPAAMSIAVGQPGILIGMLPMVTAYLSLLRGNSFIAGTMFGFMALKPQFLLSPAQISGVGALSQNRASLASNKSKIALFALGALVVLLPNILLAFAIFRVDGFVQWLDRIHATTDYVYSGFRGYEERFYLISSLPMAVAYHVRTLPGGLIRLIGYTIIGSVILAETFVLWKIVRSRLSSRSVLDLMVVSALTSFPMWAPYLRIYDLTLLLLPFLIIMLGLPEMKQSRVSVMRVATVILIGYADVRALLIPMELATKNDCGNSFLVAGLTAYWLFISFQILAEIRERQDTELV
ncbi:MAG: DUF2029 domain-containing protein [Candidatus Obscuribacterales bacterium]|nr:DUF2029 domain-containing protein [Candidatus Obscuribacterales bacterium]